MTGSRRVVVVGAGAWGLPAAAELARRGHPVTLVDRVAPAHRLGSSAGPTRIWRLAHPDRLRVRLARRGLAAWRRLEARSGQQLLLGSGLLWRGEGHGEVAAALAGEGVTHEVVGAADVTGVFPGLRPNGLDAVWQPEAGAVLAAAAMAVQLRLLREAGGVVREGVTVRAIEPTAHGVRVVASDGATDADVAVIAAGPWSRRLLLPLGVDVPLRAVVQQVTYVGGPGDEALPCLIEVPASGPALYAMPTPGRGYKIGIDAELRTLDPDRDDLDPDRTPSPRADALVSARVARDLPGMSPVVTGSDVCCWTYGPRGEFVVDTAAGGRVVLGCGDSGEGFKFSALMGEVLADLAEGRVPDADVAALGLARFGGVVPPPPPVEALGRI